MTPKHETAPRLGGSALWFVSALLRTPLLGPALARVIGRDVVDARLRHAELLTSDGNGPAPLYAPPPPPAAPPRADEPAAPRAGGPSW